MTELPEGPYQARCVYCRWIGIYPDRTAALKAMVIHEKSCEKA